MHKIRCNRCGNYDAEILRRGKFADNVTFCPHCDDLCNELK